MSQSSEELFDKARERLAGGVSQESRFKGPFPKYIDHAEGSRKYEVDGKEYVDYAMGSASLLLGHAHPKVVAALTEQATKGTFFADCHPLEVEWAGLIQELIPCAERVRFVSSGTEATMLAIRIGRASSGKNKILRFEGHYHGWHEFVDLGMNAPYDEPTSLGILPGTLDSTVVVKPNLEHVADALKGDHDIGTIICEVSGANYGSVPLPDGFLPELRRLADEYNAVLIFDEVITGFRWSPGGRQARDGVLPDICSMAKIVTGGMPGGAVGGREEFMRLLDPTVEFRGQTPGVTHKGTFNGAGYGEASTFHLYLGDDVKGGSVEGLGAEKIRGIPKSTISAMQSGLRKRGVDLMSHMSGVTSMAHTEADVDETLQAFEDTIQEMIADGHIGGR